MKMNYLSLILAHFRRLRKDWKLLIGVFSLPIMAILAITILTSNTGGVQTISIGIVNLDSSRYAQRFVEEMRQDTYFEISLHDIEQAREEYLARRLPIILTIPEGFFDLTIAGETVQMDLMRVDTVPGEPVIERANQIIRTLLREDLLTNMHGQSHSQDTLSTILFEEEQHDRPPNRFLVISLIITFMMFSVIFMSHELIDLKRKNLFFRMFATPHSPARITSSLMGTIYMFLVVQTIGLFLVGSIFMRAPLVEHNLFGTILLMGSFILFNLSLGVVIARICKTPSMLGVWSNVIILPSGMISGVFVPKEFLPDFLNQISFLAPQHWVVTGLQKMNVGDSTLSILPNIMVLLLFSACLFSIGIFRFDRMVKS